MGGWRQVIETYDFRNQDRVYGMHFSKKRSVRVKFEDHIIPQVKRFKYLESIVQND